MYAKNLLDSRKVKKLRSRLRKDRLNTNAYELSETLGKERILAKYQRFEKVRTVADYEEAMEKGEPVFLKEMPFKEKDDPRCCLF